MNNKDEKVSYDFSDDYKDLPLKERVKLNKTAHDLLEFQKEHSVFIDDAEETALEDREAGE